MKIGSYCSNFSICIKQESNPIICEKWGENIFIKMQMSPCKDGICIAHRLGPWHWNCLPADGSFRPQLASSTVSWEMLKISHYFSSFERFYSHSMPVYMRALKTAWQHSQGGHMNDPKWTDHNIELRWRFRQQLWVLHNMCTELQGFMSLIIY